MRNTLKVVKYIFSMLAVALAAFTSAGTTPAHASVDTYLFGYTYQGVGDEELILNGGAITIQATSMGWYENNGTTEFPGNTNYIVGVCGVGSPCYGDGGTYRDFFSFNLSGVTGPITSASLEIFNPSGGFNGDPSTYTVYGANTIASALLSGVSSTSTYNSMTTSGNVFGATPVDSSVNGGDLGSDVTINLDANALASLNFREGGTFTVAGALGSSVSSVPLPAGLPMFVFALLAMFGAVQFSKKRTFA